jgi:hypothetical protein
MQLRKEAVQASLLTSCSTRWRNIIVNVRLLSEAKRGSSKTYLEKYIHDRKRPDETHRHMFILVASI